MRLFLTTCLLALAGCGGGGTTEPEISTADAERLASQASTIRPANYVGAKFTSISFIGNSLTYHQPSAALGWSGDWGMAASARDKDYAHLTAAALSMPLQVLNLSVLEADPASYASLIPETAGLIDSSTAVVIELGDNVTNGAELSFMPAYEKLLDAAKAAAQLVCLSSWQARPALDAKLKAACEARGGSYVYIGDIYPTRKDVPGVYANAGVDSHPHDWSMAVIAQRTAQAFK